MEHIGLNCQVNCVSGWYLLFSAPCTMRACFSSSRSGLSLATTMPSSWSCIPSGVIMKFSRVTWTEKEKTLTVLGAAVLKHTDLVSLKIGFYFLQEPQMATDSVYDHKTNFSRNLYTPRFCDCLLAVIRPNISLITGCDTCESLVEHIL